MTVTTNYTTSSPPATANPVKTRIACYERVSTEEQVHGYSIAAQKAALDAYCKERGLIIVGHYTDEGISGGKPASKRPAMARLLQDVEHGLIDCVLFCKLDRWFRNVPEYFKTQEVLDAHGVTWNAIQEDYETETASGRMTVTIMLSVAQNERERTSERIKAVFDYRAARGEFLSGGQGTPLGYKVVNHYLEKDPETEPAVDRLFSLLLSGYSLHKACTTVREEYPQMPTMSSLRKIAYKPIYAGIHNGTPGYCPAYITAAQHETILSTKHTRSPRTDAVYLFSGILRCPVCGRNLTPMRSKPRRTEYIYYRCLHAVEDHDCPMTALLPEYRLESLLTAFVFESAQIVVDSARPAPEREKPGKTAAEIERKMKRLAETYTDGLIDHDAYKRKLADLTAEREAIRNAPRTRSAPPVELVKAIVQGDIKTVYYRLNKRQRKRFWMSAVSSFTADKEHIIDVNFIDGEL